MSKATVSQIATGQAPVGAKGSITGLIINSHSSGVIKLIDSPNSPVGRVMFGGAAGYTLPAGSSVINFSSVKDTTGIEYYEGVHFVLVSGTADVQLLHNPGI